MTILILKSLALLLGTFLVSAWLGWNLARRARSHHSAFEAAPRAVFAEPAPLAMVAEPVQAEVEEPVAETEAAAVAPAQPVSYLDAAAEAFTSGVVVPFKADAKALETDKSPYAPPQPAPRLDMVAAGVSAGTTVSNVLIRREDHSLQRKVSSLARMTPESIEAAVQQAGSGLEPTRLGVPQTPPDDLTVISGIDAEKQRELNALGIFYYWQVATWTPENVAWLSSRIEAPQRLVRENWMSQAARLGRLN